MTAIRHEPQNAVTCQEALEEVRFAVALALPMPAVTRRQVGAFCPKVSCGKRPTKSRLCRSRLLSAEALLQSEVVPRAHVPQPGLQYDSPDDGQAIVRGTRFAPPAATRRLTGQSRAPIYCATP